LRVLAVDWGERRIGLAVSDPTGTIATGLPTVIARGREDGIVQVAAAAVACEADQIVVGLPLLLSGERGTAAAAAEVFATALAGRTGLPVETYDERLTSVLGQRRLHELGGRRSRQKASVDQSAAVALLESFLVRLAHRRADAQGGEETS
jgi:putative Holliday junction resolvase